MTARCSVWKGQRKRKQCHGPQGHSGGCVFRATARLKPVVARMWAVANGQVVARPKPKVERGQQPCRGLFCVGECGRL